MEMANVYSLVKLTTNSWLTFSLKHIHFGYLSSCDTIQPFFQVFPLGFVNE